MFKATQVTNTEISSSTSTASSLSAVGGTPRRKVSCMGRSHMWSEYVTSKTQGDQFFEIKGKEREKNEK